MKGQRLEKRYYMRKVNGAGTYGQELRIIDDIRSRIYIIRGVQVMLDRDLAELYDVSTKALNQAVKRNIQRFPEDFRFQITDGEKNELVTNCDRFKRLKHSSTLPYAFTEQGVAMLSSVLNSDRAIEVNIAIMRAFVKLRQILATHKDLARKLSELEDHLKDHDEQIQVIFEAIKQLMVPEEKSLKRIGFNVNKEIFTPL